jgi:hypothetical protein
MGNIMNEADGGPVLDRRAGEGNEGEKRSTALGAEALLKRVRAIEIAGVHRRQEELIENAVEEGVEVTFAEQVHALALEEGLAPAYALALVASGIGVEELVEPESGDDESIQQAPPDWVLTTETDPAVIARERRLRLSMRRMRSHLDRGDSAQSAVERFLAEPDVGHIVY